MQSIYNNSSSTFSKKALISSYNERHHVNFFTLCCIPGLKEKRNNWKQAKICWAVDDNVMGITKQRYLTEFYFWTVETVKIVIIELKFSAATLRMVRIWTLKIMSRMQLQIYTVHDINLTITQLMLQPLNNMINYMKKKC